MPLIDRSFPAETLKAFRTWCGLSQDDVASILGISTRSVQMYEEQGGPEWVRYALLGWATILHGVTPRKATRKLGLPWQHYPRPEIATDEAEATPHDPRPDVDADLDEDVDPYRPDAAAPMEHGDRELKSAASRHGRTS
jgi:transcriptional regulator with XRE-family HTH domain